MRHTTQSWQIVGPARIGQAGREGKKERKKERKKEKLTNIFEVIECTLRNYIHKSKRICWSF
jgi:hypothetical protein